MSVQPSSMTHGNHPTNFLAAMNVYDAEYINYYTGLKPTIIYATGHYYGGGDDGKFSPLERPNDILFGPGMTTVGANSGDV